MSATMSMMIMGMPRTAKKNKCIIVAADHGRENNATSDDSDDKFDATYNDDSVVDDDYMCM